MTCESYRRDLVAFVRGDLGDLPRQRLASHLARCAGCQELERTLAAGFTAARAWAPDVSPEHLERLTGRIAPWLEAAPAPRRQAWPWAAAGAAVAFAVAALVVVLAPAHHEPAQAEAAVELAPTPWVRVVAEPRWDGAVSGGPTQLAYAMTRGAAAFDFVGGAGRRLAVRTPLGEVRAVGTRFAVAVAGDVLTVAVGEGTVAVTTAAGERAVPAGVEARYGRTGDELGRGPITGARRELLDRPFLAQALPAPAGLDFDGLPVEPPGLDVGDGRPGARAALLGRLERAEQLAEAGEARQAVVLYVGCAREPAAGAVLADLCRYEAARLTAFALGEPERARPMLERLARVGQGESRRQAALALCELDRERDRCLAVRCLRGVARAAEHDEALRREASRLAAVWAGSAGCAGDAP